MHHFASIALSASELSSIHQVVHHCKTPNMMSLHDITIPDITIPSLDRESLLVSATNSFKLMPRKHRWTSPEDVAIEDLAISRGFFRSLEDAGASSSPRAARRATTSSGIPHFPALRTAAPDGSARGAMTITLRPRVQRASSFLPPSRLPPPSDAMFATPKSDV